MTFPNLEFAIACGVVLFAGLLAACWYDLRTFRVPKWVTIGLFAAGVVANLIRGVWVGADGFEVWTLGPNGAGVGLLDGLLFSLAGFAVGFGLYFLLWIFGVAGGADVKLGGALGAWFGPRLFLVVVGVGIIGVIVLTVVRVGTKMVTGRGKIGLSYSLPLTIGAVVTALFIVGVRVRIAPAGG